MTSISTPQTTAEWHRRVVWLAVPIILSNLTVPLVGIVDTAVMGRMDSSAYLSATAIAATLFSSIYWIFGFLRMGTSGLLSQALGAANHVRAERTALRSIGLALVFGVLTWFTGPTLFTLGMWSMRVPPDVYGLAESYFSIRLISAPATLMLYSIIGILVGQQRMPQVLAVQLLLNVGNIILTIWFFAFFDWHIKGVAAATVISEYAAAFLGLWLLRSSLGMRQHLLQSESLAWIWDKQRLAEFFRIGRDLFIRTLCLTASFYWLTVLSSRLGVTVLAVNAILLQMVHFMSHALDGFSHAAETLAGHAYGKRDRPAFSNAVKAASIWGAVMAMMFTVVYALFGSAIFNVMTTQTEVQNAATTWLWWVALTPLIGVWSFLLDGIFIGTTHTREMRNGMIISTALFLSASLVLVPLLGNHGLWSSYCILMLARAATLGWWYPRLLILKN
jgi:MATE family multidrug resistance protein